MKSLRGTCHLFFEKQSSISFFVVADGTLSDAQSAVQEEEAGGVAFFQTALCPAKPWKFSF